MPESLGSTAPEAIEQQPVLSDLDHLKQEVLSKFFDAHEGTFVTGLAKFLGADTKMKDAFSAWVQNKPDADETQITRGQSLVSRISVEDPALYAQIMTLKEKYQLLQTNTTETHNALVSLAQQLGVVIDGAWGTAIIDAWGMPIGAPTAASEAAANAPVREIQWPLPLASIKSAPFERSPRGVTMCSKTRRDNLNTAGVYDAPSGPSARETSKMDASHSKYFVSQVENKSENVDYFKNIPPEATCCEIFMNSRSKYGHTAVGMIMRHPDGTPAYTADGQPDIRILDPYITTKSIPEHTSDPLPLANYLDIAYDFTTVRYYHGLRTAVLPTNAENLQAA